MTPIHLPQIFKFNFEVIFIPKGKISSRIVVNSIVTWTTCFERLRKTWIEDTVTVIRKIDIV